MAFFPIHSRPTKIIERDPVCYPLKVTLSIRRGCSICGIASTRTKISAPHFRLDRLPPPRTPRPRRFVFVRISAKVSPTLTFPPRLPAMTIFRGEPPPCRKMLTPTRSVLCCYPPIQAYYEVIPSAYIGGTEYGVPLYRIFLYLFGFRERSIDSFYFPMMITDIKLAHLEARIT